MPEISALTGFREDTLDLGFERAGRVSFTLVGYRADDPPLDMDLVWTYTIGASVRLTGHLRQLQERLSPNEDFQRYELTDRLDDVMGEPFLRTVDVDLGPTARFTFNDEKGDGSEQNLQDAIEAVVAASTIITGGVTWIDPAPNTVLIEKNIQIEGRGIGEFISELLKFGPTWRWYYDSANDKLIFRDLSVVNSVDVYLSKIQGKWSLRSPNFNNVIEVDINIDKTNCFESVRLEGLGEFKYTTNVTLDQAWIGSDCLEAKEKAECDQITEPYYPEDYIRCPSFACRFKFPDNFKPAPFSFSLDDGKFATSQDNPIVIEAYIPKRNLGLCKTSKDFPGGQPPPELASSPCIEQETPYEWVDFEWSEVARLSQTTIEVNSCGEKIANFCPKKMYSTLYFWSPPGVEHYDKWPDDPKVLIWEMRAKFWNQEDSLVVEATGGCPNGRVYQRYNVDWVKCFDDEGNPLRDDSTFMQDLADSLLDQVGRPRVSANLLIHLHPRDTFSGLESYTEPDVIPYIDYLGIAIGDAVNINYETPGAGELVAGPGILPNADGAGGDLDWENMNLSVMGLSFNRREQTLSLEVANTAYIFGDRELLSLQR